MTSSRYGRNGTPFDNQFIWQIAYSSAAPVAWDGLYDMLLWSDTVRAVGTAARCCGSSADTADTRDLSLVSGGCHVRKMLRRAMVTWGHQRPKQRKLLMSLTLEEANRMLDGALTKARELNIRISTAICDAGGRLVAFQRMDNAIWASAYASQGKAVASAAFGRASGELQPRADQPTPRGIALRSGGEMILGQGAVPILRDGIVIG